jgi:hypothetical protein
MNSDSNKSSSNGFEKSLTPEEYLNKVYDDDDKGNH